MPAWRAASPRELPSSTRARASIRREAAASRQRFASRRRSPALSSRRGTATVIVPSRDRTLPAERTGCDRGRLRPCGRVRNRGRWYYIIHNNDIEKLEQALAENPLVDLEEKLIPASDRLYVVADGPGSFWLT